MGSQPEIRPDLDLVEQPDAIRVVRSLEQGDRVGGVRVHAEEAIVLGRDRRREDLALDPRDRRVRVVVDQQLVGEAAHVDAEPGRQTHRDADAGNLRQAADDGLLLRPQLTLFIA